MASMDLDDDPPTAQLALFDAPPPRPPNRPEGLVYETDWLSRDDERALIEIVRALPFAAATYKAYTARRRVVGYGGRFDYDRNVLMPAPPLVDALHPLRARVARWSGLPEPALEHVLVSEYVPGTPLGWHRDVPDFEDVIGVSLGAPAVLRFRPYPPEPRRRADVVRLTVAAAVDLPDARTVAVGVAAQRRAGRRAAVVDHVPHAARRRRPTLTSPGATAPVCSASRSILRAGVGPHLDAWRFAQRCSRRASRSPTWIAAVTRRTR